MMEHLDAIAQLIREHQESRLSDAGQQQLDSWLAVDPQHRALFERLNSESGLRSELKQFYAAPVERIWEMLKADLSSRTDVFPSVHRVHFLRTAWFRYAAAVVLLLGVGGYLLWSDRNDIPASGRNDKEVVQAKASSNNRAILTLADGSQIILDDKATGNIAQQGNTQIIKLDGNQLAYNSDNKKTSLLEKERAVFDPREAGQKPGVASYNTITTPKGSQYQVILPDGTKAWLNAASSIKFPTAFTGDQRQVTISGEAYLEIKKDPKKFFIVKVNNQPDVIVIGTSFNVNAYKEDGFFKVSLLEGAVKVIPRSSDAERSRSAQEGLGVILNPGQAYLDGKVIKTDLNQDIAWKNGVFNFNGLHLQEAMNQLARWYDLEIVYEGKLPPFDFYGEMWRNLPLNQVLQGLSGMSGVNFKVEGKKLIVSK